MAFAWILVGCFLFKILYNIYVFFRCFMVVVLLILCFFFFFFLGGGCSLPKCLMFVAAVFKSAADEFCR